MVAFNMLFGTSKVRPVVWMLLEGSWVMGVNDIWHVNLRGVYDA